MLKKYVVGLLILLILFSAAASPAQKEADGSEPARPKASTIEGDVRLITLDPGHFHAALVQKIMYPGVSPVVSVYAPPGSDVDQHLKRIEGYNARADNPTHWEEKVYTGADFLQRMLAERSGNVLVLAGNNREKINYINAGLNAGLTVLADVPRRCRLRKTQRRFQDG
jgi:hypothetical protein